MGVNIALEIDASELTDEIQRLQSVMTEEQFNKAMHGIFKRTGTRVKTILKNDLPQKYQVKKSAVGAVVAKRPLVTTSPLGVGCVIPLKGKRLTIGSSNGFKATGGAHGKSKRKYTVKAKILKSGPSAIQDTSSYGGEPAFRNLDYSTVAFTRAGKSRLPISRISGIAIPQMPMNKSQDEVQEDIKTYLKKQMDARFKALMLNGR